MPDISQMKSSKFIAQGDVLNGPLLGTMLRVHQENVAKTGAEEELKWCLSFSNIEKPLVLNQINMELIAKITGSTNTDHWTGKQIVIYNDPNVAFGGRVTGGLRVRAPRLKPGPAVPPALPPARHTPPPIVPQIVAPPIDQGGFGDAADDDVPF